PVATARARVQQIRVGSCFSATSARAGTFARGRQNRRGKDAHRVRSCNTEAIYRCTDQVRASERRFGAMKKQTARWGRLGFLALILQGAGCWGDVDIVDGPPPGVGGSSTG